MSVLDLRELPVISVARAGSPEGDAEQLFKPGHRGGM
jgi:hypothetical protein